MDDKVICYVCADLSAPASLRKFRSFTTAAANKGFSVVGVWPGYFWQAEENRWKLDFLRVFGEKTFCAVFVDAEGFEDVKTLKHQAKIAKEKSIPFFVLDMEVPGAVSILFDDRKAFFETFHHLTEEHNCKNIFYLGDLGMPYASARCLEYYREAIEETGAVFDESKVAYCNSVIAIGMEGVLVKLHAAKPDAIICSHPSVANVAVSALGSVGLSVPEDLIVASVNCITGRRSGIPDMTGGSRDFEKMAVKSIDLLEKALNKKRMKGVQEVPMTFRLSESCGCGQMEKISESAFMRSVILQRDMAFAQERKQNTLLDHFFKCRKIEELTYPIQSVLPEGTYFCIRDSFLESPEDVSKAVSNFEGFSVFATANGEHVGEAFDAEFLHRAAASQRDRNEPLILYPIFMREGTYGVVVGQTHNFFDRQMMMVRFLMSLCRCFFMLVKSMESTRRYELLQQMNESLRTAQIRDPMTGMFNNNGLIHELEKLRERCVVNGENLQIISVDLDHLGSINDIYGHTEGDSAIIDLAQIIKESVNVSDICAHLGGDEFMIVSHHTGNDVSYIQSILVNLQGRISDYNNSSDKEYTLNINVGTSMAVVYDDSDMTKIIDDALANKRLIKNNRRNKSHMGTDELSDDEKKMESAIKDVIDNNLFRYAYQPIVSAEDGSIFGYEALMRSVTEKPISPLTMIKYATINHRLYDIERATFFNIFKDVKQKKDIFKDKKIFVNSIPGYQIDQADYTRLKKQYSSIFKNLFIEVTEQTEQNDEELRILTERSSSDGFSIAIDDYGSGYSNTSSLLRYAPQCVKLDRLLISDLHSDPRKQHFVKNIIEFAHANNFYALAEGVETAEELKASIALGVDLIQGFYLARPDYEILEKLPDRFVEEIKEYHSRPDEKHFSKYYVVSKEKELSVTRLALEMYTDILVSSHNITLYGNLDYRAAVKIKVKEHSNATITLRNIILDNLPEEVGIELGERSTVTIVLEGDNYINSNGIRVPESATLKLAGNGNLTIQAKNNAPFGIGNDIHKPFGNILSNISGNLTINVDGERAVGIGGHLAGEGARIFLKGGDNKIISAATAFVGIGSFSGKADVDIFENHTYIEYRVINGLGIGSITGDTKLRIANCFVEIYADGRSTTAIGSTTKSEGNVEIVAARLLLKLNASRVMMIGSPIGNIRTYVEHSKLELYGSGERVLGIGNSDMGGELIVRSAGITIMLTSNSGIPFGIRPENLDLGDTVPEIEIIRQTKDGGNGGAGEGMPPGVKEEESP